jgi:hypothetical protein
MEGIRRPEVNTLDFRNGTIGERPTSYRTSRRASDVTRQLDAGSFSPELCALAIRVTAVEHIKRPHRK